MSPLYTLATFERQAESVLPKRNFGDILKSQLTSQDEGEQQDSDIEDIMSMIVETDNMAFYMRNQMALFSREPRTADKALSGPYAEQWKKAMDSE